MLGAVLRLEGRHIRKRLDYLFHFYQVVLAYRIRPGSTEMASEFYQFKLLMPPKDRCWADPFPVKEDDMFFIFFEDFPNPNGKGHIAVIEMDAMGACRQPIKVLERPYHLSYPFVFEWDGTYYMIPETSDNRTIELYRCVSFPLQWKLEKVLIDGVTATDATIAHINDRWWMFTTISGDRWMNFDELYIFHASTPLGPWEPHKRNPVKSDVRSSRPAGRIFEWKGHLYRPAQDGSKRYGYAISINRIEHLDDDCYVEKEVSKILPHWRKDIVATHTLNNDRELTVTDAAMRRRK
jgi:hypothetical protein